MSIDHHEVGVLAAQLHEVSNTEIEAKVRIAVGKVENDAVADMQNAAAVDTGNMRAGTGSDSIAGGMGFRAGPTADYGVYVEYGTSRMNPQPFVNPAFDRAVTSLERALGSIGRGALG